MYFECKCINPNQCVNLNCWSGTNLIFVQLKMPEYAKLKFAFLEKASHFQLANIRGLNTKDLVYRHYRFKMKPSTLRNSLMISQLLEANCILVSGYHHRQSQPQTLPMFLELVVIGFRASASEKEEMTKAMKWRFD